MNRREFEEKLNQFYDTVSVLSEAPDGNVVLLRHKVLRRKIVVRISTRDLSVYQALKTISHPNLVRVLDAFPLDDGCAAMEEALPGKTVDEILKSKGLYTYPDAKKVLDGLCQALSCLHEIGIVHRDLKPENVMILPDGELKLLDFDAARLALPTKDTVLLGTAGYAAPEQYVGASNVRSDIYALGVLFNILLTGVHPSEKLPDHAHARRIILKATSVSPDKRFSSAESFRAAL